MPLIDRVSRLLKADLHAVLDRIEDPEQALKLAMRDMHDEHCALEERGRLTADAERAIARRIAALEERADAADRELDIAFQNERDDLARAVIRRKLVLQRKRKALEAEARRLAERHADIERMLDEQRAKLDELRGEIAARCSRPDERRDDGCDSTGGIEEHDIEIAFLRERDARSGS